MKLNTAQECAKGVQSSLTEFAPQDAARMPQIGKYGGISSHGSLIGRSDDVHVLSSRIGMDLLRRSQVEAADGDEAVSEGIIKDIPLIYQAQYAKLPDDVKLRCTWEELKTRLLAFGRHYLLQARNLRNGGNLVYIDEKGNPVFRNDGLTPILIGKNYNIIRKMLYGENYQEGAEHYGYEMPNSIEELRKIEEITGNPFVESEDRKAIVGTFMESGGGPFPRRFYRIAFIDPRTRKVDITTNNPYCKYIGVGVTPMLRVKKMV